MSAVRSVLPVIRERIAGYQGKSISEMGTKTNLINPMLDALGWDLGDLEQVRFEYRYRPAHNPVDYALMDKRTPHLFVEAKALGTNLGDHRWADQIMGYTGVAGVAWVVLSDGNEYRIYNTHASVPVEKKLFRTIRLTDEEDTGVVQSLDLISRAGLRENRLEAHWQEQFVDRQVQEALKGLFGLEPDTSLVNVLQRRTNNLTRRDVAASLRRVRAQFVFPLVFGSVPDASRPPVEPPPVNPLPDPLPSRLVRLRHLIAAGVIQPPLNLHSTYLGQTLSARIETDGSVTFQEKRFGSLSLAGNAARIAAGFRGKRPATNGWRFWRFTDADGQVKEIDVLRQRYLAKGGSDAS